MARSSCVLFKTTLPLKVLRADNCTEPVPVELIVKLPLPAMVAPIGVAALFGAARFSVSPAAGTDSLPRIVTCEGSEFAIVGLAPEKSRLLSEPAPNVMLPVELRKT